MQQAPGGRQTDGTNDSSHAEEEEDAPMATTSSSATATTATTEPMMTGGFVNITSLPYIPDEEDLPYEEDVLRNPYSLKSWWRFIEFKQHCPPRVINLTFERALRELPGSYKIWFMYLRTRVQQVRGKCITDKAYDIVNNTFERALVFMHKMPRIWVEYIKFLIEQKKITRTRRTCDRALRSLPILQHTTIWKIYIKWVKEINVPLTIVRVYKRYLKLEPESVEDYIDYLEQEGFFNEAAVRLSQIVEDDKFVSQKGKSKHQMWMQLCALISKHPKEITSLKVEPIIRNGIRKFTDEVGRLWVSLAQYYVRLAHFEKARDIFEEGMDSVTTVRDFSMIWDSYTKFEDRLLTARINSSPQEVAEDPEDLEEKNADFELRVARYENLVARQPLLISGVLLRQNPHNVYQWHKRAKIYKSMDNIKKMVKTYSKALATVDPQKATGKPHLLWAAFARFYAKRGDHDSACTIFEKGIQQKFKYVDDLASLWCDYIEMEIRHQNYDVARKLCQRATTSPRNAAVAVKAGHGTQDGDNSVHKWLFKSIKLWLLYADLEESFGTFQSTKAVYEKILDLRIATPQVILNFAAFLEEHKYFEEGFKAFERGVNLFHFPHALPIWLTYLTKFVERYRGQKLERARDLFEQVLEKVPAKDAKIFYIMYAALEEEFGLARHAMAVYDRATRAVHDDDKYKMYLFYIARAGEYFGIMKTREIYQRAVDSLPDKYVKEMCLRFANMERRLGEIDRARAIYTHVSQYCDPRLDPKFWETWREFEVQHGNSDTFREMLRVRRSVQALYNTQVNFAAIELAAQDQIAQTEKRSAATPMEQLEREAKQADAAEAPKPTTETEPAAPRHNLQFVSATSTSSSNASNPEAVDLEDDNKS
ncbi:pre-mRNA-splicing factor SYF1 [Pelomyxa schiedti]|nr:pre-mRNA-splicing factor SYF1 [Pelomyxa schiedti]